MNAREFTNQLEELVNHPAQKLVGNISSGYINLTDDEVKKRCIMASAISSVPSEISTAYISYDKCWKNIHSLFTIRVLYLWQELFLLRRKRMQK